MHIKDNIKINSMCQKILATASRYNIEYVYLQNIYRQYQYVYTYLQKMIISDS